MEFLCLMGLFPKEYEKNIIDDSITGMQNAANKLQWNIVKGLDKQNDVITGICNSLYIGSYPRRYKKCMIPTFRFKHNDHSDDVNVGFLNLTGIKMISRYYRCRHYIKEWANKNTDEERVLLAYAMTIPFTNLCGYVTKKYPNIKVCLVVPDLPEFMNPSGMSKRGIYSIAKKIAIKLMKYNIRNVEHYILLTESMRKWFKRDIKYTVIEGIADPLKEMPADIIRQNTILYAGGIRREYGVIDLVNAFMDLDAPEWELVIYGDGCDFDVVSKLANQDKRIKLMGSVANEVVVEHQKRASILVNPRRNQEFTKYSFPSKVLEYMGSGTPMLAYKLDGVPEDYDEFYFHIPDEDNGLKEMLQYVVDLPEDLRNEMGNRAADFVREVKNPEYQCKKIVELMRT